MKCNFLIETNEYLGHFIHQGRLEIASHTTDAIKVLRASRNAAEFKLVFGLCNVSRRFVPDFAIIESLSNKNLRKDWPFNFMPKEKQLDIMRSFQKKWTSEEVLGLPVAKGRKTLHEDACDVQFGCVLLDE